MKTIDDRFAGFETDNQMLLKAMAAVHTARQAEDAAYKRFSGKDFATDDLKAADGLEDKYMSVIRGLNALLYLPETEPLCRKAQLAVQLYKDFNFSVNDGFEAEARKTVNMVLIGIEDRAKLYCISGGKTGGNRPTPDPDEGGSDSSDGGDDGPNPDDGDDELPCEGGGEVG